jgi:SAM-dependent methyltransferase
MTSTQEYYEKNAKQFIKETLDKEMHTQYALFERHIQKPFAILDAGCGSGRDSLYFKGKGHQVTAFDNSQQMCSYASGLLGQEVLHLDFEALDFQNCFDAIWASASLLHISKEQMPDILQKLVRAFKDKGTLYASFKYGENEFTKEGRFFNAYTEESFTELIKDTPFTCEKIVILQDTRPQREDESWLNAILTIDKS